MPNFNVTIDIKRLYRVQIEADSEQSARDIGEAMQSTEVYEQGSLVDVETNVVEVEPE